jgi:single-strand DNA-binding protein
MASMNKVILVGNLTKDPELKFVPSGMAVANLRLATNRKWKAQNGEWKDEVTYVSVDVWGKSAEACGEYLKKGSPILVEGRLKLNEWTAQDGSKRSTLIVVSERLQFLSGGKQQGAGHAPAPDSGHSTHGAPDEDDGYTPPSGGQSGPDDDIPF